MAPPLLDCTHRLPRLLTTTALHLVLPATRMVTTQQFPSQNVLRLVQYLRALIPVSLRSLLRLLSRGMHLLRLKPLPLLVAIRTRERQLLNPVCLSWNLLRWLSLSQARLHRVLHGIESTPCHYIILRVRNISKSVGHQPMMGSGVRAEHSLQRPLFRTVHHKD